MPVFKMKDKPRKKPWCYEYREGDKKKRAYFKTEKEAKEIEEDSNSLKRRTGLGLLTTIRDLERYTVRDIIRSYMDGKPQPVLLVLHSFSIRDICSLNLFEFNEQVAEQCAKDMLKDAWKPPGSHGEPKPISPATVRWRISHIQLAWKMARKWPGLRNLENPWKEIRIDGSTGGQRDRSLEEGELETLIEACKGCLGLNQYYIPLAIVLAVETGMRRQEILNLTWEDIDFKRRRIIIRKSKTDKKMGTKGGVVVLTLMSEGLLGQLALALNHSGQLPGLDEIVAKAGSMPEGKIFPMTGEAFTQAFSDVVTRAKLDEHLTFHDLRRTANMTFIRAGLLPLELNIAMRHAPPKEMKMNGVYTNYKQIRTVIQEKLDRYKLDGQTVEEIEKEEKEEWLKLIGQGLKEGLTQEEAVAKANAVIIGKPEYVQLRAIVETIKQRKAANA